MKHRLHSLFLTFGCLTLGLACSGSDRPAGVVTAPPRPLADLAAEREKQSETKSTLAGIALAEDEALEAQILFGDLHVHTTYSIDAFTMEMPLMGLQGIHTPADACDFARHCSGLDFFSLNDHAENLTPEHWQATKDVLRQCDALAGSGDNPDIVPFAGWEWTQVREDPNSHWGHKNVIFPTLDEESLPARPISSIPDEGGLGLFNAVRQILPARWIDPLHWKDYTDLGWLLDRVNSIPLCPKNVPTRELPLDCRENAPTPQELYGKLDEWGFDTLIIPHGNAWGLYTPNTASWDKALNSAQHDPSKQQLIEVMSGHGNSEEYRSWRPAEKTEDGDWLCPAPTADYLACCWQAGEILRGRCGELPEAECEKRVLEARTLTAAAGPRYRSVLPETTPEEWLDCGQCRDCFKPSFAYRPLESTQYALSLSNFDELDEDGRPLRFRFGFIASTDDHTSRPGTGYKQYERRKMTFATGLKYDLGLTPYGKSEDSQRAQESTLSYLQPDGERVSSFAYPGGIVAVHANGRSREAIWKAMKNRQVYGTSGPRILLWFDLLNGPEGRAPMGSEVVLEETPRFEVRAAGSFEQLPGCPATSVSSLSPERLEYLCAGECRNPSDSRHPITEIEVVRIRPQSQPEEDPTLGIEDPWLRIPCEPNRDGCVVHFEDPEFQKSGRDTVYYVRALQEPTPAINGDNMRARRDPEGNTLRVDLCHGDSRTDLKDDCLAPNQERAWSSPIYIDFSKTAATRPRVFANQKPSASSATPYTDAQKP